VISALRNFNSDREIRQVCPCLIKIASLEIPRLKCDLGVGVQPFADNFAERCKIPPKMQFNKREEMLLFLSKIDCINLSPKMHFN
jgi:hypothetical protein